MNVTSVGDSVDFSSIRYGQCWEDADVLLEALDVQPGDVCLSIASAGDNTLALASRSPARIVAIDISRAQLACLELRIAMYRTLEHPEVLELVGCRPSDRRLALYRRCRDQLGADCRRFWDDHPAVISGGIGGGGKFEEYFKLFRSRLLPLVHSKRRVMELFAERSPDERDAFYRAHWDNRRWRLLFSVFFSRLVMGRLGRDPHFFDFVEGSVADRIRKRAWHGMVVQDPSRNPYLHWIATGAHGECLPYSLRPENFDAIRSNLDSIELACEPLESYLSNSRPRSINRFNLSDIFEYMPVAGYEALLDQTIRAAQPGARLAYWNLLVPRSRPDSLSGRLRPLSELAKRLHDADKTFFYGGFVVEEVA